MDTGGGVNMPKLIGMRLAFVTTTPLNANGTVTSGNILTAYAERVTGTIYTDQPGTLYIEWSSDGGTNWDGQEKIDITGGSATIDVSVKAPLMRIRYVNGTIAQTVFRLYVWLR
jgi:hypothetical protein